MAGFLALLYSQTARNRGVQGLNGVQSRESRRLSPHLGCRGIGRRSICLRHHNGIPVYTGRLAFLASGD